MFSIKKTLLILASVPMFLSATEYQLSTHVLDITSGQPAPKVKVELYKLEANQQWKKVSEEFTEENGRIGDLLPYEKLKIGLLEFISLNFLQKTITHHTK